MAPPADDDAPCASAPSPSCSPRALLVRFAPTATTHAVRVARGDGGGGGDDASAAFLPPTARDVAAAVLAAAGWGGRMAPGQLVSQTVLWRRGGVGEHRDVQGRE
jgi:hypothetical protein